MAKTFEIGTKKSVELAPTKVKKPRAGEQASLVAVAEVKRGRGRPRTSQVAAPSPNGAVAPTRQKKTGAGVEIAPRHKRISNDQLLQADRTSNRPVPLPTNRIVEQLTSMLGRAEVQQFRGRKERPTLVLSMLEQQSIQEALILFQMKLEMQRGGERRR